VSLAVIVLSLAGCAQEDPQLVALREQLLLTAEPAEATTISEAKAGASENPRVVFVARVTGDEREAFVPGHAAFVVTEILADDDGHGGKDHADNCPFCQRKSATAPRAAVQFVDESGQPLAVDSLKLFGIRSGDAVVICGKGELLAELDMFQVTADGVYVRRNGGGR